MKINKFVDKNKLFVVLIAMGIIWGSLLFYYVKYAEEISNDPCSICAARMNEDVFCTIGTTYIITRTYFPNFSIEDKSPDIYIDYPEINYPKIN